MNTTLITGSSKDYELLDSGEGEKLERYGKFVLSRPDPQALWPKNLNKEEWEKADAVFVKGGWKSKSKLPSSWPIDLNDLKFLIKPTIFKHTGVFPEQVSNWQWIEDTIKSAPRLRSGRSISVINLFGYTGGATLAAARAGVEVTHVDASRVAISWAKENAEKSGLKDAPIRWILDDARKFLKREIKRGKKYDGIIMDPPSYGHGSKKEVWKIERDLLPLLELTFQVLYEKPLLFLINGYAAGYSPLTYENNLKPLLKKYGGKIEKGDITISESSSGRLLPCGIFARWQSMI